MMSILKKQFTSKVPILYNKKGARLGQWEAPDEMNSQESSQYLSKIHNVLMKESGNDLHPQISNPSIANRVLETVNPGEFRRIKKRDDRRKKDRAIVRDFCKKVLYINDKHIPH